MHHFLRCPFIGDEDENFRNQMALLSLTLSKSAVD
jgi:hypothetical protein